MDATGALVTALLAMLAGCSGVPVVDTPADAPESDGAVSVTPASVPEVTTTGPGKPATAATEPPGVDETAIDVGALAQAHADRTANESYRLTLVFERRRSDDGVRVSRSVDRWQVRRAGPRRYNASRERIIGTGNRVVIYRESMFAGGGRQRYVRVESGANLTVSYRRGPATGEGPRRTSGRTFDASAEGPFVDRTEDLVGRYLAVENVTVTTVATEDRQLFRVFGTGATDPALRNATDYRVEAFVRASGFVERMTVTYERSADPDAPTIVIDMRYDRVGNVSVSPPPWLDAARAATAENATTTETTSVAGTAIGDA